MADSATQEDQCHPRKIFVGGLAHKTTTQALREHFQRHGPIVDAVVLRWPDGRSRGFGYVTFSDVSSATGALRESHHVGGRAVDVKRAVPGTNKVFVGGLPQNTNAAELRKHFEGFGVVSDAVVMIDPSTNRSRGFGFVCFLPGHEGAAAVAAALAEYPNHRIRGKWIEVKSAAPPHKLAQKENQDDSPLSTNSTEASASNVDNIVNMSPPGLRALSAHGSQFAPHQVGLPVGQQVPADGLRKPEFVTPGLVKAELANIWASSQPSQDSPTESVDPDAGIWANDNELGCRNAYMDASRGLQRSLEQLLRLKTDGMDCKTSVVAPGSSGPFPSMPFDVLNAPISFSKTEK